MNPASQKFAQQTIALAGVAQVARMVDQISKTGTLEFSVRFLVEAMTMTYHFHTCH